MVRRITLAAFGLVALTAVLALRADEPGSASPKKDESPEKVKDSVINREQVLLRQFQEFEQSMLKLKQRLERSPRQEDRDRAALLAKALDRSRESSIIVHYEQMVDFLKKQKFTKFEDIEEAKFRSEQLANELRDIINLLKMDGRAAELREKRKSLEKVYEELKKVIRNQKQVRAETELGKTEKKELNQHQVGVSKNTKNIHDALGDKKGQGGEAKDLKSDAKSEGKGQGHRGEAKDVGKKELGKTGTSKDAGKNNETKQAEAKGGDGKKGDGQEAKAGDAKGGQPKDGQAKTGDPKDGQGQAKAGSPKAGEGQAKAGSPKAGEPKAGSQGQKSEQAAAKGSKGGEAGKQAGGAKGSKSGEGQQAQSKSGSQSKQGEAKGGKSGSQQAQSKSSGQQSDQQQANSKDGGKQGQQPQQQSAESKIQKRIADARYQQDRAQENIQKGNTKDAVPNQDHAIDELEKAKKRLEDLLRQLREEEVEKLLADLEARCHRMLGMQIRVREATVSVQKSIDLNKGKRPNHANQQDSLKLSDDEKKIVLEASEAIKMIEEEGSAVAFAEVFVQVRDDMRNVQNRLGSVDTGPVTVATEDDIIATLKEMIDALKKAQQQMQQSKSNPSPPQPPPDQKLLDQIAELKMIRSMQLRVNQRTKLYAQQYQGEQAADPNLRRELNQLSDRQERIFEVTNRIARGDNR